MNKPESQTAKPYDPADMAFRLAIELDTLAQRVRAAGEAGGAIVNWEPAYKRARALLKEFHGGPQ
jgi:hypothetical protein